MQHWDIVVAHDLDYFQAQILRYTMRWKKKNGLVDLQKAKHMLEKYIEVETKKNEEALLKTMQDMQDDEAEPTKGYVDQ